MVGRASAGSQLTEGFDRRRRPSEAWCPV